MFDWRFAAFTFALFVLLPGHGAAQAPYDAFRQNAPAAAVGGPGIDTREPQGPSGSEMTPAPAQQEARKPDQEKPGAGDGADDPAREKADAASDPATIREGQDGAEPPHGAAGSPATARDSAGAPRETAPVAQPLDPPPSAAEIPGIADQAPDAAPAEPPRRPADITITVATWQSAYNQAQRRAMLAPFRQDTEYNLDVGSHGGDMRGMTAARARERGWDLIELDAETAARGCSENWLSPIAAETLPESVEGDVAKADYLPGALLPCAVASAAWSAVMVYDTRAEFEQAPASIGAMFDLPRFPGARAFPKQAPYLLEFALMADGVAPADVYSVLATPAGQDRAFAKLSAIRHAIRWWGDPATAIDMFAAGQPDILEDVVMGIAFNGRVFTSVVRARGALRILWDAQIYQFNYWAIPKSAPESEAARELLRYVSLPERQARLTQWFPYGPPRRSALPLVGRHAEIDIDMADFVPTMPRHMQNALRFDPGWWEAHGEALERRFADWLARPEPSAPVDQFIPPAPVKAARPQAEMTVR